MPSSFALLAAMCMLALAVRLADAAHPAAITAVMKPTSIVPVDKSKVKSTGSLSVVLNAAGLYTGTVKINNIVDFQMAHIHEGVSTTTGPVVVWAYPYDASGLALVPTISGSFSLKFVFNNTLLNATVLKQKGYYFNVHTTKYPAGEIRGQLLGGY